MKSKKITRSLLAATIALATFLTLVSGVFAACSSGGVAITCAEHQSGCTEHTMYVSDTLSLTATSKKEGDTFKWSEDSDKKVVTVSKKGVVSAKGAGTAQVTVESSSGKTATLSITVLSRTVTIATPSSTTIDLADDGDHTIVLSATASDGGEVVWSSSDAGVAEVNGGVVTALDVGTVIITAQRGAAKDSVEINVVDSGRAADYRALVNLTNANCRSQENSGLWQYHADSEGTAFSYTKKPVYQASSLSVTFAKAQIFQSQVSQSENKNFQFRIFPVGVKNGETDVGIQAGDKYKVSFTVVMNVDGKVSYGTNKSFGKKVALEAGVEQTFNYSGTATDDNDYVFYISPKGPGDNDEFENGGAGVAFEVKNIVFTRNATVENPTVENPLPGGDPDGKNATVKANPGEWRYFADSTTFLVKPHALVDTDSTTVTGIAATIGNIASGYCYFRYMPTAEQADGDGRFTVTLTVTSSAAGKVKAGVNGEVVMALTANEPLTITYTGNKSGNPFYVAPYDLTYPADGSGVSVTVTEITFRPYEQGDTNTPTNIVSNNVLGARTTNANTIADPGKWKFWSDAESVVVSIAENNGTNGYTATLNNYKKHFSYRYQPSAQEQDAEHVFTITFTVTASVDAYVRYGNKTDGTGNYLTQKVTANTPTTITFTGTAATSSTNSEPFSIRLQSSADDAATATDDPAIDLVGQSFTFCISAVTVTAGGTVDETEPT